MEAATERINSASWREKFHRTSNSYPTTGRPERRIVGSGAEILHKSPRYYDTSPGDAAHQDGRPKEELRKWSSAAFQQWNVHQAKNSSTLAELLIQMNASQESSLNREILLSQLKDEVFLTSATRSVDLQANDNTTAQYLVFQGESSHSPGSVKSERSSPANPCSIKSEDSSQSAITSPGLTTELENFQDLTVWCQLPQPKAPKMSVETDELTARLIEFGDFMFQSPTIDQSNDNCYGLLNVQNPDGLCSLMSPDILHKHDNDNNISCLFGQSNYNINKDNETSYQYFINDIGGGESKKNTQKTTLMDSSLNNIFTKCADNIYSESINEQLSSNVFALETDDAPVFELDNTTVVNAQDVIVLPLETEQTNVSTNTNKKNLQFDFSNIWTTDRIPTVIDTPEVINTALALDKSFNLINFITNDKDATPSIQPTEPQFEDESRSTTNDPDPSYTPSEASDDEDYEPPSKKNKKPLSRTISISRKTNKKLVDNSDSDLSNISTIEPALKVIRRGRPPKRNVSISSESTNADNDGSRYRELRDKNNEASRRSRLNRKMKEICLEEEAKDLDVRNRKLKVQVQEMERQVNTLRTNLMQMLLKK